MNEINQEQLEEFRKLGFIDEIALRNYYIRKDFKELRKKRIKVNKAITLLANKYNRSEGLINIILYKK